jgi:hypothetical protein
VTKIKSLTIMNLVVPKAGVKHELLFNEPASGLYFDCVAQQLFSNIEMSQNQG